MHVRFRHSPRRAAAPVATIVALSVAALLVAVQGNDVFMGSATAATSNPTPNANCSPNVVPLAQANPPGESQPMAPSWCFNLTSGRSDRAPTGPNEWLDEFETGTQMQRLADGDIGYRVFDNWGPTGAKSQHFINNDHWMTDLMGGKQDFAYLRPNQSFTFENGKLVVEAEVAAAKPEYVQGNNGVVFWPEIVITDAPAPDSFHTYGGDSFDGHWVFRCIMYPDRHLGCAYLNNTAVTANESDYVWKFSWFEHSQFSTFNNAGTPGSNAGWRQCQTNQMDWYCRDRFRFEITKTSITTYVNGVQDLTGSGLQGANQISDALVKGNVYVYLSDVANPFSPATPARFFWGYLHVNPHNPDGTFGAPSAAEGFCPGQAQNTCPPGTSSAPPATATPTRTSVPATRTPTRTPVPPTAVPQATSTATPGTAPAPTPSFTSGATAAPTTVSHGAVEDTVALVTSKNASTVLVDVEVYNSSGQKIAQQWFDQQSFNAGQSRTYDIKWPVPVSPGTYTVKIGIYNPGWGSLINWNNNAIHFTVQ